MTTVIHNRLNAEQHIRELADTIWIQARIYWPLVGEIPSISCTIRASRVAGVAFYAGRIEYNLAYICTLDKLEDFNRTIVHELAHIIQFRIYPKAKQAHGVEFRGIMARLGYDGSTYHKYSVSKAKSSVARIKGQDILLDL